jgi:hypothetical protein
MQQLDTIKKLQDENLTLRVDLERQREEVENEFERIVVHWEHLSLRLLRL